MDTRRRTVWVLAAGVALAAAIPYLNSLSHGFAFDDDIVVLGNPLVREGRFSEILFAPYHADQKVPTGLYRPLTTWTFALNHAAAAGFGPRAYHAVNVALHALASVLVLTLGLALGLSPAAAGCGGLLFAVHPVHVEAVANVSGRAELLSALFFLLAVLAYVRLRTARRAIPTWTGIFASTGAFFLALLAKENAVTFPAVAIGWELLLRPHEAEPPLGSMVVRTRRGRILWALLFFGFALAFYLGLRHAVLGTILLPPGAVSFVENPVIGQTLPVRFATAVAVLGRAAGLLVLPWKLSPDYSYAQIVPVTSPAGFFLFLGILAGAALLVAFLAAVRGHDSAAASFLIFFGIATYSVTSNCLVVIGTIFAERLLYLPSVAFCLLAGLAWARLAGKLLSRRRALALCAAVLVAAAARAAAGSAVWRNDLTLFAAAARSSPRSVKVLGNLAVELASAGRLEQARQHLTEAVALAPDFLPNRINLAGVFLRQGDLDAGEREIRHALALEPDNAVALAQLGLVRMRQGDLRAAEEAFRRALAVDPRLPDARLHLAEIHIARNDFRAAERELAAALAEDPTNERVARALESLGHLR